MCEVLLAGNRAHAAECAHDTHASGHPAQPTVPRWLHSPSGCHRAAVHRGPRPAALEDDDHWPSCCGKVIASCKVILAYFMMISPSIYLHFVLLKRKEEHRALHALLCRLSCIYMYALQVILLCIVSAPCGMSGHQQLYGWRCPSQAYSQAARLGCSAIPCNPSTVNSQCAAHCCRLAQHYQLQLVSAKTILAAADELGGSTKQVVNSCQLCKPKQSLCSMQWQPA